MTAGGGVPGAIGVVQITSRDGAVMDALVEQLGLAPLGVGAVVLRDVLGVDEGLATRPAETCVQLMPHGGVRIVDAVCERLEALGCVRADTVAPAGACADPRARYPEAGDLVEACVLDALGRAASPRAIDVLCCQPGVWRSASETQRTRAMDAVDLALDRLIVPPTVAAIGATNVGKSTLVNALAKRTVAVVADAPGTTRDHVGVHVDLDGVVVRWIDTPGVREGAAADPIEQAAMTIAREVVASADVVVLCADANSEFSDPRIFGNVAGSTIRCATRCDLGERRDADVSTSLAPEAGQPGRSHRGLADLATLVRQTLVPNEALTSCLPWRFHPSLAPPSPPRHLRPDA